MRARPEIVLIGEPGAYHPDEVLACAAGRLECYQCGARILGPVALVPVRLVTRRHVQVPECLPQPHCGPACVLRTAIADRLGDVSLAAVYLMYGNVVPAPPRAALDLFAPGGVPRPDGGFADYGLDPEAPRFVHVIERDGFAWHERSNMEPEARAGRVRTVLLPERCTAVPVAEGPTSSMVSEGASGGGLAVAPPEAPPTPSQAESVRAFDAAVDAYARQCAAPSPGTAGAKRRAPE